ncbi:hypothetical protein GCM10008013_00600 [Paenibacillus segetis]|uniref:Uncharacterized protein n=1 Tax=Paenibacillus segetis TaxID=1325360 RepID=A0ABQ1Y196_9BACL|nr:hypothetical protein GCM10008013_00600 [Paenibacillus segetis]
MESYWKGQFSYFFSVWNNGICVSENDKTDFRSVTIRKSVTGHFYVDYMLNNSSNYKLKRVY